MSDKVQEHSGGRTAAVAKSDGAYFTTPTSATMLSELMVGGRVDDTGGMVFRAVDSIDVDWGDAKAVAKLKVMDPACGDGELLLGALAAIVKRAGEDAARAFAQYGLIGIDIDAPSVQSARQRIAETLPGLDPAKLSLFVMPHGKHDDTVRAGSLELFNAWTEGGARGLDLFAVRGEICPHIAAGPDTWEPHQRSGGWWVMMSFHNGFSAIYCGPFASEGDAEAWRRT